jgi:hypothetical protein
MLTFVGAHDEQDLAGERPPHAGATRPSLEAA